MRRSSPNVIRAAVYAAVLVGLAQPGARAATVLRTSGSWTSFNQPNDDVTITGGPQLSQAHVRRADQRSYHADVNIGTITASDPVQASGTLTATNIEASFNTVVEFGYFDTTASSIQFGIALAEQSTTTLRMWLVVDGSWTTLPLVNLNVPRTWSLSYDPVLGRTTAVVDGTTYTISGGSNVQTTNAFGWLPWARGTGSSTGYADLTMENVAYSVGSDAATSGDIAVPEPATAGLLLAAAALLLRRARR